eukprot:Rhum_TRINITY_DN14239_c11_g1::Rhum_TRINITY_DN14239_c11_g1_i1::g.75566::m.75566
MELLGRLLNRLLTVRHRRLKLLERIGVHGLRRKHLEGLRSLLLKGSEVVLGHEGFVDPVDDRPHSPRVLFVVEVVFLHLCPRHRLCLHAQLRQITLVLLREVVVVVAVAIESAQRHCVDGAGILVQLLILLLADLPDLDRHLKHRFAHLQRHLVGDARRARPRQHRGEPKHGHLHVTRPVIAVRLDHVAVVGRVRRHEVEALLEEQLRHTLALEVGDGQRGVEVQAVHEHVHEHHLGLALRRVLRGGQRLQGDVVEAGEQVGAEKRPVRLRVLDQHVHQLADDRLLGPRHLVVLQHELAELAEQVHAGGVPEERRAVLRDEVVERRQRLLHAVLRVRAERVVQEVEDAPRRRRQHERVAREDVGEVARGFEELVVLHVAEQLLEDWEGDGEHAVQGLRLVFQGHAELADGRQALVGSADLRHLLVVCGKGIVLVEVGKVVLRAADVQLDARHDAREVLQQARRDLDRLLRELLAVRPHHDFKGHHELVGVDLVHEREALFDYLPQHRLHEVARRRRRNHLLQGEACLDADGQLGVVQEVEIGAERRLEVLLVRPLQLRVAAHRHHSGRTHEAHLRLEHREDVLRHDCFEVGGEGLVLQEHALQGTHHVEGCVALAHRIEVARVGQRLLQHVVEEGKEACENSGRQLVGRAARARAGKRHDEVDCEHLRVREVLLVAAVRHADVLLRVVLPQLQVVAGVVQEREKRVLQQLRLVLPQELQELLDVVRRVEDVDDAADGLAVGRLLARVRLVHLGAVRHEHLDGRLYERSGVRAHKLRVEGNLLLLHLLLAVEVLLLPVLHEHAGHDVADPLLRPPRNLDVVARRAVDRLLEDAEDLREPALQEVRRRQQELQELLVVGGVEAFQEQFLDVRVGGRLQGRRGVDGLEDLQEGGEKGAREGLDLGPPLGAGSDALVALADLADREEGARDLRVVLALQRRVDLRGQLVPVVREVVLDHCHHDHRQLPLHPLGAVRDRIEQRALDHRPLRRRHGRLRRVPVPPLHKVLQADARGLPHGHGHVLRDGDFVERLGRSGLLRGTHDVVLGLLPHGRVHRGVGGLEGLVHLLGIHREQQTPGAAYPHSVKGTPPMKYRYC